MSGKAMEKIVVMESHGKAKICQKSWKVQILTTASQENNMYVVLFPISVMDA